LTGGRFRGLADALLADEVHLDRQVGSRCRECRQHSDDKHYCNEFSSHVSILPGTLKNEFSTGISREEDDVFGVQRWSGL
jgi:hypothetical protein